MKIYCPYIEKCKPYNKQCKTCDQRVDKKMNQSELQKIVNETCKTKLTLPNNSEWLARCKRCKYYDFSFYENKSRSLDGKYRLRQHTIVKCTNPKGTMFDNANCFVEAKDKLRNIRKSRMPIATVKKMKNTKEVNRQKKMVKLKCKESISIEDGLHTGKITKVEYRTEPYDYTDVFIQLDDIKAELKYGCPTHLSENSKLGRLISLFVKLTVDKEVDIDKVLIGKELQFQTVNKTTAKGTFAEILGETIKVH